MNVPHEESLTANGGDMAFDMYERAVEFARAAGCVSASRLQRGLGIGYVHAARLIDLLEQNGVVGPKREGHVVREMMPES